MENKEMTKEAKRAHCLIFGRVQGVLFRFFTKKTAESLGLAGFVRNLPDGSVEAVAEGGEDDLKKLIAFLEKGTAFSEVEKVEVVWGAPTGEFSGFRIVYSGFMDRF